MKTVHDKTQRKCPDGVKRDILFIWERVETLAELAKVATEMDLTAVNLYRSTRAAEKVARGYQRTPEQLANEKKYSELAKKVLDKFPGKTLQEVEELLGI